MSLERPNLVETDATPKTTDPEPQLRRASPLRLVRLGPSAPRTSYEQAEPGTWLPSLRAIAVYPRCSTRCS